MTESEEIKALRAEISSLKSDLREYKTAFALAGFDVSTSTSQTELRENHRFVTSQRKRCEKFGSYAILTLIAGIGTALLTKGWAIFEAGLKGLK